MPALFLPFSEGRRFILGRIRSRQAGCNVVDHPTHPHAFFFPPVLTGRYTGYIQWYPTFFNNTSSTFFFFEETKHTERIGLFLRHCMHSTRTPSGDLFAGSGCFFLPVQMAGPTRRIQKQHTTEKINSHSWRGDKHSADILAFFHIHYQTYLNTLSHKSSSCRAHNPSLAQQSA